MTGNCECDCCRIHDLLHQIGAVVVKRRCAALFEQGYTRDEVNVALNERFIPALNDWVSATRDHLVRGCINETSAGYTIN